MPKKMYKSYLILFFALSILLAGVFGASLVFAVNSQGAAGNTPHSTSATPAVAHLISKHSVNMSSVPTAKPPSSKQTGPSSGPENERPVGIDQLKAAAAHNSKAPVAPSVYTTKATSAVSLQTPGLTTSFQGLANSSTICPPNGCAAPDQALAG